MTLGLAGADIAAIGYSLGWRLEFGCRLGVELLLLGGRSALIAARTCRFLQYSLAGHFRRRLGEKAGHGGDVVDIECESDRLECFLEVWSFALLARNPGDATLIAGCESWCCLIIEELPSIDKL